MTQKVMKKKPKKGAKNTKPVTKTEQCDSFFNFFSPPQVPEDDDIDQETVAPLPSTHLLFPSCDAYWYQLL
jgi:nucleosome assembly protein 1-like 1